MRRDASLFLLAVLSPLAALACNPIVVGGGGGSGGAGGSSTATCTGTEASSTCTVITGAGGDTATQTGTWTFTGTDGTCSAFGGKCAQFVPDLGCPNGVWDDWNKHACSGDDANCCFPVVCTPGADQTCNHFESMSSFAGHCEANGLCTCFSGHPKGNDGKCQ